MDPPTSSVTDTTPRPEESPSTPAVIPQTTQEPAPTGNSNVNEPSATAETPSATEIPAAPSSSTTAQKQKPAPTVQDDSDEDSEFDELDDVLDNFSKPAAQPTPPPASQPGAPAGAADDLDEAAFLRQLEQDMAKMIGQAAQESGATDDKEFESTINQGADAFTQQLEESGIPPGDFLKQLLADVMAEEEGAGAGASSATVSASASASASAGAGAGAGAKAGAEAAPESFNDAIQRTIHRMQESGDKATAAATEEIGLSEDVLMQLLKNMDGAIGDDGNDVDFTKMIAGMMEYFTNKEMLYEPMKELNGKWGPWLQENRGKVSDEDFERYEKQAKLVSHIVEKFEEKGYTDKDPAHRGYVWEKMQEMQALGSPPEEIMGKPWPEGLADTGNENANVPDCPQQ